jgi:DNA polymerase
LFETGLDLLIDHLKNLSGRRRLRLDHSILEQIERLQAEPPAEAGSPDRSGKLEGAASEFVPDPLTTSDRQERDSSAIPGQRPPAPQFTSEPATQERRTPGRSQRERQKNFEELRATVLECTKCPHLAAFRHSVVFGVGNPEAELMFVGEAPGADEDLRGEPFVGRAGELLTRIIETMGFERKEVYIANVLKCRPDIPAGQAGNRPPTPEEMQTCLPYLRSQIELIQPKVLVALGSIAIRGLLGKTEPMKSLRGRWLSFGSIPLMVTFHPSYLLRNQALSEKRKVWEDMLQVLERLNRPISERQRNYFLANR